MPIMGYTSFDALKVPWTLVGFSPCLGQQGLEGYVYIGDK